MDFDSIPPGEFCIYGTMIAVTGHADELEDLMRGLVKDSKSEDGVLDYYVARDTKDPNVFHLFERYASKDAFLQHVSRDSINALGNTGWVKDTTLSFVKPLGP